MVNYSPTIIKNNDVDANNSSATIIKNNDVDANNSNTISLVLKPSANLSLLFNQFNNVSPKQKNEPKCC